MKIDLKARQQLARMDHDTLSLRKRCNLLSVNRSNLYYEPKEKVS